MSSRKMRRLSTDSEGDDDAYSVDSLGMKAPNKAQPTRGSTGRANAVGSGKTPPAARSRRNAPTDTAPDESSAVVSRNAPTKMRLTVKTSANKLREATAPSGGGYGEKERVINLGGRESFVGGEILEGKRKREVKRSYVVDESEDEEEEEEEEEDDEMGDVEAELDEDEDEEMDDGLGDEDAEGEEDDMDDEPPPPPPVIKISRSGGKQSIVAKPQPSKGKMMSVEQKEVQNAEGSDEELSDLDSDMGVEEEEAMQTGNEEDAEGEDEEMEVEEAEEEEEEEEDDEIDSDDDTPGGGNSRASTPDLNKLTKRQRARLDESSSGHLMALPDEVQVKKHLTAEEHAMRRAEMARRRKNLSEKRNEEEKMETINKLLKKQAPKTNARRNLLNNVSTAEGGSGDGGVGEEQKRKPDPLFVRWVSNKDGNRIGVPEEWLDGPVGAVFGGRGEMPGKEMGGKLVQEVS